MSPELAKAQMLRHGGALYLLVVPQTLEPVIGGRGGRWWLRFFGEKFERESLSVKVTGSGVISIEV